MTESTATTPAAKGGLSAMLLPELKKVAGGLGIKATGMKKAELVSAIKAAQGGGQGRGDGGGQGGGEQPAAKSEAPQREKRERPAKNEEPAAEGSEKGADERPAADRDDAESGQGRGNRGNRANQNGQNGQGQNGNQNGQAAQNGQPGADQGQQAEEEGGSRRNRRRRGRDRAGAAGGQGGQGSQGGNQGGGQPQQHNERRGNRNEPDLQILEDDVLAPCAGILDVLDSYAFVRTSGYMPGTDDVYVSLSTVRKYGLRRGDAIVGQVRQPREGDRKEKFNPLVKIDSINGGDPEAARTRVNFGKLTPLHPTERLRLETTPTNLVGRVIDLVAPIGKGQRALLVSPAKAGKTTILKAVANSITTNNPECHLMVVLVDERPEEVTDFERSVNGEVISSTFDRPASDHIMVAELAIERAKRLVELGHDVVVLLDGLTRLGRAYNLGAPASGRILPGGVDSAALFPPKQFFGAARKIEDGGSLTILASASVESGSKMDEIIFEELRDTANSELHLRGELADKAVFPAVDAARSGTRHEDQLISSEELAVVGKLRRTLSDLEPRPAIELLLDRVQKSQTNLELLMQVQKS